MRLNLEGLSEELAGSIYLYDVLTIRGTALGGAATSPPLPGPQLARDDAAVASGSTKEGAATSPSTFSREASSTGEPMMSFTSSSTDPIAGPVGMTSPCIHPGTDEAYWDGELALIVAPLTGEEDEAATMAHGRGGKKR